MSKMIEINLNPDDRTLRHFGWIAFVGFSLLALLAWKQWLLFSSGLGPARTAVAGTFFVLGVISASFSMAVPKANRPLYVLLTLVSYPIGFVFSHAIMVVLFYGLLTPVGLFFRLLARDPLQRRFEPESPSYWVAARDKRPVDSYFKQF